MKADICFFFLFSVTGFSQKKKEKVIVLSFPSAAFDLKCQEKRRKKKLFE